MHRRLGWILLAALATAAHAEPAAPVRAADPVQVATAATAPPAIPADLKSLRALTDDPVVGRADRIDGEERHGVVAFTFDDGPNPETSPAVIEALEKYNIPATFFIVT